MRQNVRACVAVAWLAITASGGALAAISVGNLVWDDRSRNGVQDGGEPGIAGVTVQLWNAAKTQLIDSATTNANGNYTLVAPGPGDYRVRVLLQTANDAFAPKNAGGNDLLDSDVNPSGTDTGFTDIYTFASNLVAITTLDAGILRPVPKNVGNFVWHDLDEDGVQDAGEPGIAGVTVQLWNAAKTQLVDSATTNANGNYTLVAPTAGDYRVRFLLPAADDTFSPKDAGGNDQADSDVDPTGTNSGFTDAYTFASNLVSITTIDAGIVRASAPPTRSTVGNRVWRDADGNGVQDAGEPGIAGVTVQLWNSTKTALVDQTTTNSSGAYALVAPFAGDYRVRVLLPGTDRRFAPKDAAGNDDLDSDVNGFGPDSGFTDVFTVGPAATAIASIDAGIVVDDLVPAPVVPTAIAVEYYHAGFDHWFVTASADEIHRLDSGAFAGWARTGSTFKVVPADASVASTTPVCRFYIPPALGDSHFYSASPAECEQVRAQFFAFVHESPNVFRVFPPDTATGACPVGTIAVHRTWNQRVDSNHRYTTSVAVLDDMVARGHVAEGYGNPPVVMCTMP